MKLTSAKINKATAKKVGDALKVDWNTCDINQFAHGLKTELEHGSRDKKTDVTHDDALKTGKIVLAHLKEVKNYYTKLKKVENGKKQSIKKEKTGQRAKRTHERVSKRRAQRD